MKLAVQLGVAALLGCTALVPAARAQTTIDALGLTVTATPAVTTDYLFRGISQTRGRPAAQFTLDVQHSSGFYIGGFVSNVAWPTSDPPIDIRQEVDFSAGYRFELAGTNLDLGFVYYGYPGYDRRPGAFRWDWYEIALRASREVGPFKLLGSAFYSPNFNYQTGDALYIEGGFDLAAGDSGVTLSARAGYQWIERNPRWGAPDYAVFSLGLSREIYGGVIGTVTFSHTTLDRNDCFAGTKICGTRVVATLTRPF